MINKQPRKIIREINQSEYMPYLKPRAHTITNCRVLLGKHAAGYCHKESFNNYVIIPSWAKKRGHDYFIYYIAHELSHAVSTGIHGKEFYKQFVLICPDNCQHYEFNYKPRNAKYGIKKATNNII